MPGHRPSPHTKERFARYWARSSNVLWLLLILTILSPAPTTWAAGRHLAKAHQAKEKTKTPPPTHAISFDYSIAADGHNELLIQGDAPMKNYKSFLLANPSRLVLDIPGVNLHGNAVELPVNGPELSRIRIARHPDKVRFVFDLAEGKNVRHTVVEQNNGLKVLFFFDKDQANPQTAMAADTQEPVVKKPSPSPGRQFQTLDSSDLETIFGNQQVSVVFNKTPILDFAKYLSEKSGRRIEVSPGFATTVSLRLTEVPLHTLVNAAAGTIGFVVRQDGERIILHPANPRLPTPGQKNGEAP